MGEKTLASRAAEISQCLKEETNAGRKDAFRYECMKTWAKGTDWSVQAHRRFSFMDMVPMCRVACARMLGVSAGKITTWCGWLSQGHVLPPQDMRSAKQCRDDHASVTSAHALWTWVYEYIAEPLAESRMTVRDFDVGMKVQKVPGPWHVADGALEGGFRLRSACEAIVHDMGEMYHAEFKDIIKWRGQTQHSQCNDCARFKAFRRCASSEKDVRAVTDAYLTHLRRMVCDRRADTLLRHQARLSVTKDDITNGVLSVTIDGMNT
ncbi:unnamed protein product [Symbiodinium natans]|uniref:Uncharacterized protein n=1 Tax=Symbiodinium natans TaxID=878477 RepID=A0A812RZY1_9DINO|nr:unnamed protein product [Symbiodinium natans]